MTVPMIWIVVFLRVLIAILGVETSIRYAWWWWKVAPNGDEQALLLRTLMLGIAFVQFSTACWAIYALSFGSPLIEPEQALWVCVTLTTLATGTMLHLVPAWRISCGFDVPRTVVEGGLRVLFAFVVVLSIKELVG